MASAEWQARAVVIGEAIGGVIASAICQWLSQSVQQLIASWSALDPSVQRFIVTFFAAGAAITAFMGVVGLLALAITMLINPFTLAVGALAAFIAAYTSNLGGMRAATDAAATWINNAIGMIADGFFDLVVYISSAMSSIGNGRIGRLMLNILTMKNGYCPVIIPPIRRSEYITALQKTNKGDLHALRAFILSVVYEEMKSLRRLVETLAG